MRIHQHTQGFSLIEVIVATVIFGITVGTAMLAAGAATKMDANAATRIDASYLADFVVSRLRSYATNDCESDGTDPNDLAADINVLDSMFCLGPTVVNPPGGILITQCVPEYPRTGADLFKIFGSSTIGVSNTQAFGLDPNLGATGINNMWVSLDGTSFRVVWNVRCNYPGFGQKTFTVSVGWGPPASMWQPSTNLGPNVEVRTFTKGATE